MESDKSACMKQIKNTYFDPSVIDFCEDEFLSSDKRACLRIIANKKFEAQVEINLCRKSFLSSDKRKCLSEASTSPLNPMTPDFMSPDNYVQLPLELIDQQVVLAMANLENNNISTAYLILQNLRTYIDSLKMNKNK